MKIDLKFLSPISFGLIAYFIYLISSLIPSKYYSSVMFERNYVFLNPLTFIFVTCCFCAFFCGTKIGRKVGIRKTTENKVVAPIVIVIVLLIAMILDLYSIFILTRNNPSFLTYVFSTDESAEQIRNYLDYSSAFAEALPLLIAIIFWSNYRCKEYEIVTGIRPHFLIALIFFALILGVVTCVLKLARYELMPLIFGFWISGMLVRLRYLKADRKTIVRQAALLLPIVVAIFLIFSWIRGYQDDGAMLRSLFGYGPASYNRLALVLDDQIKFLTSGSGVNIFPLVYHIPFFSRFVDIPDFLNIPSVDIARAGEFSAVGRAGLDPAFNWVTVFGYVFMDISWFSPLFFLIFGVISKVIWNGVKHGSSFSIILYPFLAFSIIMWFGFSYFFRPSFITWLGAIFFVSCFERISYIFLGRKRENFF